jgi:hypothetical protein
MKDEKVMKVLKDHEKRVVKQAKLSKDKLIIFPIRAFDYRVSDIYDGLRSNLQFFMDGYAETVCVDKTDVLANEYREMKKISDIVGYFTAACPAGSDKILFGFSLCNPEDDFSKDVGLLKAFRFSYALKFDDIEPEVVANDSSKLERRIRKILHGNRSVDVSDVNRNSMTVRCWRMKLVEQYLLFRDKCKSYYKQFKDRWTI